MCMQRALSGVSKTSKLHAGVSWNLFPMVQYMFAAGERFLKVALGMCAHWWLQLRT